jgi:hypothetical protein
VKRLLGEGARDTRNLVHQGPLVLAGWTDVFRLLSGASSKLAVRVASRDGTEPIRRAGTHALTQVRGSNVGMRVLSH